MGASSPGFLSTHPTDGNRIKDIEGWLPEAREVVNNSECGSTIESMDQFRRSAPIFGRGQQQQQQQLEVEDEDWAKPQLGGEKEFW